MQSRHGFLFAVTWAGVLLLLTILAIDVNYATRSVLKWMQRSKGPDMALKQFLEECRSRIADDETVYLIAGHNPLQAAARLYPRPVQLRTEEQALRLRTERPEAWLIKLPVPFDRERAFAGKARDHR